MRMEEKMEHRTKKSIVFVLVFTLLLSTASFALDHMPDDIDNHWANTMIQELFEEGVIKGYSDGSFRPDQTISRAEFVALINQYFKIENESQSISYSDVKDEDWYIKHISTAVSTGYVLGYDDGTFRPNDPITRQEAALIIARLANLQSSTEISTSNGFSDAANISNWALNAINSLLENAIMSGYPDGSLKPTQFITRAEAVALLCKVEHMVVSTPVIESVDLTNSIITINLSEMPDNLSIDDFTITATINGQDYDLRIFDFDNSTLNVFFYSIPRSYIERNLSVTVKAAEHSTAVTGSGTASIVIEKRPKSTQSTQRPNTAPSTPVITKTPSGNVNETQEVTITALSTDAEGDDITYVWTGRLAETSTYPIGRQTITCKAVDEFGLESELAALVFYVVDSATGSGGVLLTDAESRIYENGIDGATITHFTFNVPSVSGHYGDDYAWVRGLNVNTQLWEYVPNFPGLVYVSNGVYMEGDLTPGVYSRLEFFYYASHCMYGQSNITYTVDFVFGASDPDVPAEAAPTAENVSIAGTTGVGNTLTGSYTYFDANGDLEGVSLYQWFRSDDASFTNKQAILGQTSTSYTVSESDRGKFISFAVTPVAQTGVEGKIVGIQAESDTVQGPLRNEASIISFTIPGAEPATIDSDLHTITISVDFADLTDITPTIVISDGATISPESGVLQNFTDPVSYTVTAEDGITTQIWTVTVNIIV